jgi:hypothetical protein
MKGCVVESVLQAFYDAELSHEKAERVAAHLATCAACESQLAEITAENELLANAFAPELSLSVPSEALRLRIGRAIEELNSPAGAVHVPLWNRVVAYFSPMPGFTLGFAATLALILLGVTVTFFYFGAKNQQVVGDIAAVDSGNPLSLPPAPSAGPEPSPAPGSDLSLIEKPSARSNPVSGRFKSGKASIATIPRSTGRQPLPGEKGYLRAIASLKGAIDGTGESALKPSIRTEYERNLAIVDHAIDETRKTARENPRDKDATAFLYASYQNKLDLLSAVADQSMVTARYTR